MGFHAGLIVEHFYLKFGRPKCIVFEISCGKNRQKNVGKNPTPAGNKLTTSVFSQQHLFNTVTIVLSLNDYNNLPYTNRTTDAV